jgi:peptidoglycan/xylan/chitin deacetylase (PgdA/CDA1 family)
MKKRTLRRLAALLAALALAGPVSASDAPKYAALTFDDGPSGGVTAALLDGLKARGVRATFFLCGYRVAQYPALAARMAAEGHELGVHGGTHRYMQKMTVPEVRAELEGTAFSLAEITGTAPRLFRPPGGLTGPALFSEARREGYPIVLWAVDPEDWRCHSAAAVSSRICRRAKDGDVILMHDMSRSSVRAALRVIDTLRARGWTFVTVPELAELRGTALTPGTVYSSFPPPSAGK